METNWLALSKFDRKVKVKWPSNMKLQQRKKRMKEKANGGKNNKTTKDVVFNMFYGDNLWKDLCRIPYSYHSKI